MEKEKIDKIDFTNDKIQTYIKKHINIVLEKENIEDLKKWISNISEVVRVALTKFDEAKDKDIILAIGNTGSGKSTMLTSLIYGTEFLMLGK